jgi:hypothetical protein
LSFSTTTGAITGIPTAASAEVSYNVTPSNQASFGSVFVVKITSIAPVTGCVFAVPSATYKTGIAISSNAPQGCTNGPTSFSFSSAAFTATGLSLSLTTGVISGTATAPMASGTVVVTPANFAGPGATFVVTLVVYAPVSGCQYDKPSALCVKDATCSNTLGATCTQSPSSFTISPALGPGLSISASGTISGTPTVVSSEIEYTVVPFNNYGGKHNLDLVNV